MPLEQVSRQLESAIETLDALRVVLRELRVEVASAKQLNGQRPLAERLRQVVEEVGQDRPARPLACPDDFVRQWNEFVAGRGPALGARALRYLCWEPDISITPAFRRHLSTSGFDMRARSIQGLVRSCHMRWNLKLLDTLGAVDFARGRVESYQGPNRVLKRWRDNHHLIFDHTPFARDMLAAHRSPHEQTVQWSVDSQSAFFHAAIEQAADTLRAPRSNATADDLRKVLFWDGWELNRFKQQVARTLLLPDIEQRRVLGELKALILSDARLRDPRLPGNQKNWVGVPVEARDTFIRWLSADDIEFFFEHVLPRGHDPHGRKPFWLRYLHQVKRSRPLLSDEDYARLRRIETEMRSRVGSFGRINHPTTSAFLLDFGPALVIEFSEPGNACYCFAKPLSAQVVSDFWAAEPFELWGFKRTDLVPMLNLDNVGDRTLGRGFRFSHNGAWEQKTSRQLAAMGIRPR